MLYQMDVIISKEELERVLKNAPNVEDVEWINHGKFGFSREIRFVVNGIVYEIEWWKNISYLKTRDGLVVQFKNLKVSGAWPNSYKTNLEFHKDGEIVAVLPLEEYK